MTASNISSLLSIAKPKKEIRKGKREDKTFLNGSNKIFQFKISVALVSKSYHSVLNFRWSPQLDIFANLENAVELIIKWSVNILEFPA